MVPPFVTTNVDALRAVERAAAAQPDERVDAAPARPRRRRRATMSQSGSWSKRVERQTSMPAASSDCRGAVRVAGARTIRVRDQQRAPEAQLARQLAHARASPGAEQRARLRSAKSKGVNYGVASPAHQSWLRFAM